MKYLERATLGKIELRQHPNYVLVTLADGTTHQVLGMRLTDDPKVQKRIVKAAGLTE